MRRLSLVRHPGGLPDAFLLRFGMDEGRDAHFVRAGIACPPSVARSVPKRRAEYLAGRRAAVAALAEAGSDAVDLAITPSRAPAWPRGFIGSITHAEGIAAALALREGVARGIGIDIERVVALGALDAIKQSVVDASEQRALDELGRKFGWPTALTIAFSAKESFYKAVAATVGRVFDFDALKIVGVRDGAIQAETAEPLATPLPPGMRFRLGFSLLDDAAVMTSCAWPC